MTVPEAAIKILQEYPDGLSAKKVTDEILAHKFENEAPCFKCERTHSEAAVRLLIDRTVAAFRITILTILPHSEQFISEFSKWD